MHEQKYAKTIFIFRIIGVFSAVTLFIMITVLMSSKSGDLSWLDGIGRYILLGATYILSAGTFVPPFVILGLRMKIQSQSTSDRINELEQEVERLKKITE